VCMTFATSAQRLEDAWVKPNSKHVRGTLNSSEQLTSSHHSARDAVVRKI
jgi:hypothetical protein